MTDSTTSRGRSGPTAAMMRTPLQLAAAAVGAVFLLVGVLGFVPGITTDYDQFTVAGPMSEAALLGLFNVSVLHNLVHLAFGVAGLALARTASGARGFLLGGGVIYLVLWVYGLVIDLEGPLNVVPFNTADNWLHLGLGVLMVGLGAALGRAAGAGPSAGTRGAPGRAA